MTTKPYAVFGALVLVALMWAHFTGWALAEVGEARNVPQSVRDNPGSSRPTYGPRSFTGAK